MKLSPRTALYARVCSDQSRPRTARSSPSWRPGHRFLLGRGEQHGAIQVRHGAGHYDSDCP